MRKLTKMLLAGCCLASLVIGTAMTAHAEASASDHLLDQSILVYGTMEKMEDERLFVTNSNPEFSQNEIILSTGNARILDAVTGMPVAFDDLNDNETIYAYIGPAMTLSLPPQASAELILAKIPADYRVPVYATVADLQMNQDGSAVLTTTDGDQFQVPADCVTVPYLTRNMVYIDSFTPGSTCLIWCEGNTNTAYRMMQFAKGPAEGDGSDLIKRFGWAQNEDGTWVYYNADGELHTGWLQVDGKWYYLNPETGIMHTGFLTVDGKTYYLQADGSMLTSPMTFTPAEDGSLH